MLETASQTERVPVKRDFNDLDSLINELGTPKENILPSSPVGTALNPDGGSDFYSDAPALEPIPAEVAAMSGKVIASTIDTALSTGFSLMAKSNTAEKYEATDKQMDKLRDAWTAVAQKYNYKVEDSPWFHVILLNVAVYFPQFKEAQKDRRFAELEEQNRLRDARIEALEKKNAEMPQ